MVGQRNLCGHRVECARRAGFEARLAARGVGLPQFAVVVAGVVIVAAVEGDVLALVIRRRTVGGRERHVVFLRIFDFEKRIAAQHLADFAGEVERRQLQQPHCVLQLRAHGLLLSRLGAELHRTHASSPKAFTRKRSDPAADRGVAPEQLPRPQATTRTAGPTPSCAARRCRPLPTGVAGHTGCLRGACTPSTTHGPCSETR